MTDCLTLIWESGELALCRAPDSGVWKAPSASSILQRERLVRPSRVERAQLAATKEALADALNTILADRPLDLPLWILIPQAWVFKIEVICPDFASPEEAFDHLVWETVQRINGETTPHRILIPEMTPGRPCEIITVRGVFIDLLVSAAEAANIELAGIGALPLSGEGYRLDSPWDLRRAESLAEESDLTYGKAGHSRVPLIAVALILLAAVSFGAYKLLMKPSPPTSEAFVALVTDSSSVSPQVPAATGAQAVADTGAISAGTPQDTTLAASPASTAPTPTLSAPVPADPGASLAANPFSQIHKMLPAGARIEFAVLSTAELRMEVSGLAQPREWLKQAISAKMLANLKVEGEFIAHNGKKVALIHLSDPGYPAGRGALDAARWNACAKQAGLTPGKGRKLASAGSVDAAVKMIDVLWKNPAGGAKLYLYLDGGNCVVANG